MSHGLIDLHGVEVVSIDNELVFLKTGIAKVVVPGVVIADFIAIYCVTSKIVRGVELISSPSVGGRVCVAMELRVEGNTREDLGIVETHGILNIE